MPLQSSFLPPPSPWFSPQSSSVITVGSTEHSSPLFFCPESLSSADQKLCSPSPPKKRTKPVAITTTSKTTAPSTTTPTKVTTISPESSLQFASPSCPLGSSSSPDKPSTSTTPSSSSGSASDASASPSQETSTSPIPSSRS